MVPFLYSLFPCPPSPELGAPFHSLGLSSEFCPYTLTPCKGGSRMFHNIISFFLPNTHPSLLLFSLLTYLFLVSPQTGAGNR
jgi:hypothetical protein